jgi:hypothetical protein
MRLPRLVTYHCHDNSPDLLPGPILAPNWHTQNGAKVLLTRPRVPG